MYISMYKGIAHIDGIIFKLINIYTLTSITIIPTVYLSKCTSFLKVICRHCKTVITSSNRTTNRRILFIIVFSHFLLKSFFHNNSNFYWFIYIPELDVSVGIINLLNIFFVNNTISAAFNK